LEADVCAPQSLAPFAGATSHFVKFWRLKFFNFAGATAALILWYRLSGFNKIETMCRPDAQTHNKEGFLFPRPVYKKVTFWE
jgi:hypothetical protein